MTRRQAHLSFGRMKADIFSGMWRSDESHIALSPIYGPPHVPSASELKQALIALRDYICELCIPDLKRASVAHHAERDSELEPIAERFRLKGRQAVCDFLRQHRILIPVLLETSKKFEEYFGGTDQLWPQLEIFTDPGDSESTTKLFAFVLTTLPFSDASARLDRLAEEWWFDQSDEVARLLNIDVEYVDGTSL